jgi:hypothetical protein
LSLSSRKIDPIPRKRGEERPFLFIFFSILFFVILFVILHSKRSTVLQSWSN